MIDGLVKNIHDFSVYMIKEAEESLTDLKNTEDKCKKIAIGIILMAATYGAIYIGASSLDKHEMLPQDVKLAWIKMFTLPQPKQHVPLKTKLILVPIVICANTIICLIGPLLEEFIFRKLLQEGLKNKLASLANRISPSSNITKENKFIKVISIMTIPVLFGLSHHYPLSFSPNQSRNERIFDITYKSLFGVALGIAKERFGLFTSVSAHVLNNSFIIGLNQFMFFKS